MPDRYQTYAASAKFGTLAMGEVSGEPEVVSLLHHGLLRLSLPPRRSPASSSSHRAPAVARYFSGPCSSFSVSDSASGRPVKCLVGRESAVTAGRDGAGGQQQQQHHRGGRPTHTDQRKFGHRYTYLATPAPNIFPCKSSEEIGLDGHTLKCVAPNVKADGAPEIVCALKGRKGEEM